MSTAVSTLPPGSMAEPATDDLPSYMTDPVGFLWERYRQYGRIFTVYLMDCFSVGQTWPQAVRSLLGDEALSFHDGEAYLRLLQIVSPAAFAPDTLNCALESLQACAETYTLDAYASMVLNDQGGKSKIRTPQEAMHQNTQIIRRHFRRYPCQKAPRGVGPRVREPKILRQVRKGGFDHLAHRTPPMSRCPCRLLGRR